MQYLTFIRLVTVAVITREVSNGPLTHGIAVARDIDISAEFDLALTASQTNRGREENQREYNSHYRCA
jgi:hypothetical protein